MTCESLKATEPKVAEPKAVEPKEICLLLIVSDTMETESFVTLDRLKRWIQVKQAELTFFHESRGSYQLSVLVPNRWVPPEGDVVITFVPQTTMITIRDPCGGRITDRSEYDFNKLEDGFWVPLLGKIWQERVAEPEYSVLDEFPEVATSLKQ